MKTEQIVLLAVMFLIVFGIVWRALQLMRNAAAGRPSASTVFAAK